MLNTKLLLDDCLPWDTTEILDDHTNLLNNLRNNLCSYEKIYKKYSHE